MVEGNPVNTDVITSAEFPEVAECLAVDQEIAELSAAFDKLAAETGTDVDAALLAWCALESRAGVLEHRARISRLSCERKASQLFRAVKKQLRTQWRDQLAGSR